MPGWVRFVAAGALCLVARQVVAQAPPATASLDAWTATASGTQAGTVPYWQAPPLPAAVIQGGAIPPGWSPQSVPYRGVGPDGRPLTMYYAPTYVFTYPIGPPVLAAPVPGTVPVNRRQARPGVAQPATMQGWNYQTQAAPPATYALPPATVARYQPAPYQYPPGAKALSGTPIVPPSGPPVTAFSGAPPLTQSVGVPVAPPAAPAPPPGQWGASAEPPPAGFNSAAATAPVAAGAAISAANTPPVAPPVAPPSSFEPAAAPAVPAQPVSLAPPQPTRPANVHEWRVVGVHDGDTVTCLDETNQQQKVRLAGIDAPEIGQEHGRASREALAELVFGKAVTVSEEGKDRYGRWIGQVSVDGIDVNRQLVASGNAWHYVDYSRDSSLAALQSQAQSQRLGLWAQSNPTPPWDFRKTGTK